MTAARLTTYAPPSGSALPNNTTALERALDLLDGERLTGTLPGVNGTSGLNRQIPFLWDGETCPMEFLPLLAWAFRLDFFDSGWPERFQRDMVKNARRLNELRGTPAGMLLMLKLLGQPNAELVERLSGRVRGDGGLRGAGLLRGQRSEWAVFKIKLKNPITIRQAAILRQAIDRVKRNCCHLYALDYSDAPLLRGLGYVRGEGYTRGII